jgi:hypothetical protein
MIQQFRLSLTMVTNFNLMLLANEMTSFHAHKENGLAIKD